ncbi:MAG TPA: ATP-binding protein [Patescibacteria group bacterium]|nr:ATP-binding protein [Patescibacteria group bacterium]
MALNIFDLFKKSTKKTVSNTGDTAEVEKTPPEILAEGMMNVRDIIAPSAIEVDFNDIRIGDMYYRTFFVSGYPRFVGANWLSPVINFDHTLLISMFYYPVKSKVILDDLRKKITELEATTMTNREKGKISDPVVEAALEDATALQEQLVKGVEKYFQFSFYITIPAYEKEELDNVSSKLESLLASLLLISKTSALQMEDAFRSCIPTGIDRLMVTRNMDTTSLATTFPFTSSDLTMEEGIMYGINKHNGSLVIFDRFSMENANSVVFAKSGAGKSYFVKLEALRHLVFGAHVMIIDPEEEYYNLCEVVGGNYIGFSANSKHKINPFDLSGIATEGENELGQKLISLVTLLKLMMGQLNSTEEAILDRALIETYRMKGITTDPDTQSSKEPPVMEDLYKVLLGGSEPESKTMADRLEKFIKGSMAGIFDSQSNINLESSMTVFSTKNLEDALRPIAFYMILDFVWTTIRRDLRKRILIVEEAWYLMQNPDSARFIYGIAKRARKYYLGLTTISQDVDDFLTSEYGKAVVTNSSIQMLFKQHPAAIDKVVETFYLSEGEKRFLLSAGVGEGLFFAGSNHVAIKVMASESEHKLITTNPEEVLKLKEERRLEEKKGQLDLARKEELRMEYKPYKAPEPMDKYTTFDELGETKQEFKPIKNYENENINSEVNKTVPIETKPVLEPKSDLTIKSRIVDKVVPEPQKTVQKPMNETNLQKDQKPIVIDLNKKNQTFDAGITNNPAPTFKSAPAPENVSVSMPTPAPTLTPSPVPTPTQVINQNNQQSQPPAQKPKNILDNKVIELRKKMLQDEDSFLDNAPSANEIMDSVEEMKRNKPMINNQPPIQNNPTIQQ